MRLSVIGARNGALNVLDYSRPDDNEGQLTGRRRLKKAFAIEGKGCQTAVKQAPAPEEHMSNRLWVFAYGTLKNGFPNHARYLSGANLLGTFRTRERYRLVLNGERFSPCLLAGAGQGRRVQGEVYAVDRPGLRQLDRLERIDLPDGYRRRSIVVDPADSPQARSCEVFVYLKNPAGVTDPRSDALDVYTLEAARGYHGRREGSGDAQERI